MNVEWTERVEGRGVERLVSGTRLGQSQVGSGA